MFIVDISLVHTHTHNNCFWLNNHVKIDQWLWCVPALTNTYTQLVQFMLILNKHLFESIQFVFVFWGSLSVCQWEIFKMVVCMIEWNYSSSYRIFSKIDKWFKLIRVNLTFCSSSEHEIYMPLRYIWQILTFEQYILYVWIDVPVRGWLNEDHSSVTVLYSHTISAILRTLCAG